MNTIIEEATPVRVLELATEVTIAWLRGHGKSLAVEDVPTFLRMIHKTIVEIAGSSAVVAGEAITNMARESHFIPAVTVEESLASKDHIISMIDGKPYKALRRHLTGHGLTAEQYRARYRLKPDYPMTSETFSALRREKAMQMGLGTTSRRTRPVTMNPAPRAVQGPREKT